jgi:cell division protein FtsI (penicillin-binding protein 3)
VADKPVHAWRTTLRSRTSIAAAVLGVWSLAIVGRLLYFQVYLYDDLTKRAARQQQQRIETAPKRGAILDREGRVLAMSVDGASVWADPTEIEDAAAAMRALCAALRDCTARDRQAIAERVQNNSRQFVWVRRQISLDQARRVAALDLPGIGFAREDRRRYPGRELAAHVLGFVGLDNQGLSGIEATYDRLIRGKPGMILAQNDGRRGREHVFNRVERPATAGDTLELTIDQHLQHIVERELEAGIRSHRAAGGAAVLMDPWTGEILALANYPTFNPNTFGSATPRELRNRAVQDIYEPGSTFKIVTGSALLEQKVVRRTDIFDVSSGQVRFGSRVIRDDHVYRTLSFEDVIVKSSNSGTIQAVLRLGQGRAFKLSEYVRRFGFGTPLSPDFPGESAGIVWAPEKLNDSALASVAIGYQVSVTALQMAAAVSVVANGGELVQPRVVRGVIRSGKRTVVPRKVLRRVISPATAAEMTAVMEAVVTDGTGDEAQVAGYTVAGKTGTASKIVDGTYSRSDYNVSFAGFVPSRNPRFALVVVVDSPRAGPAYGGAVSAPIFRRIAAAALRQHGVPPNVDPSPPVLTARAEGGAREQPTAGPVEPPAIVTLGGPASDGSEGFPDLTGLSARDATQVLLRLGLRPVLHGSGNVVNQRPAAGAYVEPGITATLWLTRQLQDVRCARALEHTCNSPGVLEE